MLSSRTRLVALVVCSVVLIGCGSLRALLPPKVPENTTVQRTIWLDQNWTDEERFWYHHASQGTATLRLPYAWFVALEQPHLKLFGDPGLLRDPSYLARFGFIPSPRSLSAENAGETGYPEGRGDANRYGRPAGIDWSVSNEHELPVGVVRLEKPKDPVSGEELPDQIGFTCAACHTGQLEYGGTRLLIDGGSPVTDLGKFRAAMGLALAYTDLVPGRFGRFANRVLGPDHTAEARAELKARVSAAVESGRKNAELQKEILQSHAAVNDTVVEGFTRLDALNRIGNTVFYDQLRSQDLDDRDPEVEANLHPITAPVNPPPIFYTSWFNWVQYDASIMQPITRNAGEALGVRALVNLREEGDHLYRSTVEVRTLYELEQLLAGVSPFEVEGDGEKPAFKGLQAPKWPQKVLGEIDPKLHARGAELYREICQVCHLPPVSSAEFWNTDRSQGPVNWTEPDEQGRRYLKLREVDVGTDPRQFSVLGHREVNVPRFLEINPAQLNRGDESTACPATDQPDEVVTRTAFAWALGVVVEKTVAWWYDAESIPEAERQLLNGYRPNCLQAPEKYKARPLEGMWATAPFLHNGSVPNLYELLQSKEGRSNEPFYLGSRVYDVEKVGYVTEALEGGFELDPTIEGNLNIGHYFDAGKTRDGFVGRKLSDDERWALIEYLKHMDDLATAQQATRPDRKAGVGVAQGTHLEALWLAGEAASERWRDSVRCQPPARALGM